MKEREDLEIASEYELEAWLDGLRKFRIEFHNAILEADPEKQEARLIELAKKLVTFEQILEMMASANSIERRENGDSPGGFQRGRKTPVDSKL